MIKQSGSRICHAIAALALAGCASTPDAKLDRAASDEMPIGYAGITTAMFALQIAKAVEQDNSASAQNAIDLQLAQSLDWMSQAPMEIAGQESFKKGRDKLIVLIKRRWLAEPPHFLDAATEAYIEATCRAISSCPSGDIRQETPGVEQSKGD